MPCFALFCTASVQQVPKKDRHKEVFLATGTSAHAYDDVLARCRPRQADASPYPLFAV
jgi:hypothetical protein